MRILSWEELTREDIAFTRIVAASYFWAGGSSVSYEGEGRSDNMLFFMLEGQRSYRIPGAEQSILVGENDLMLMPAGSCYESTVMSAGGSRGVCLQFTLSDNEGRFCRLGEEAMLLRQDTGGALKSLIEAILSCSLQYGSRLRVKALMMELFTALCASPLSTDPEELRPAIRCMEEHLERPLPVEEAAALCHMSASTFARRFRAALGEAPAAYHRHIRLKKGRELLRSGLYTVEQAAATVGFFDTAHFCRAYAAYFGEQTGQVRMAARAGKQREY